MAGFFFFQNFEYIIPLPSSLQFLLKCLVNSLIGVPSMEPLVFLLLLLRFTPSFDTLIIMFLGIGLILLGILWAFWIWTSVSFPRLGKFSAHFLSSSRTLILQMLVYLRLSCKLSSLFFIFSFCCSDCISSPVLFSSSWILSFTLYNLLLNFFYCIIQFFYSS